MTLGIRSRVASRPFPAFGIRINLLDGNPSVFLVPSRPLSEPDPQVRRAIISWEEVRAWSRGGQPEAADPPARGWRRVDLDGVFAFALFLPILFGASFGGLTAAIFVGLTF